MKFQNALKAGKQLLPLPKEKRFPSNGLFLTGFMGAGKSTVGRLLVQEYGAEFIDTDFLVEAMCRKKIPEIMTSEGEAAFREYESRVIQELTEKCEILDEPESSLSRVVALGGGALLNLENLKRVRSAGLLIYLRARPETLFHRLAHEPRPLLSDCLSDETKRVRIETLLKSRIHGYEDSDFILDTDEVSPQEVATHIKAWVETPLSKKTRLPPTTS